MNRTFSRKRASPVRPCAGFCSSSDRTYPRALIAWAALCLSLSSAAFRPVGEGDKDSTTTLEETRVVMGKWIETQQIISRERKEWQQGKEILQGRVELVRKEMGTLEEAVKQAESGFAEANKKREDLLARHAQLDATAAQLSASVSGMEAEVRKLFKSLPEPVQSKLQPLYQRIPDESTKAHVTVAERFQNVIGILNELNKTNTEIAVNYEVHTLADGSASEVKAIYVGLAQAYYVNARGEAGIGSPTTDGWKWVPSKAIGNDVLMALEILQGKQTPAFVPLPMRIQ